MITPNPDQVCDGCHRPRSAHCPCCLACDLPEHTCLPASGVACRRDHHRPAPTGGQHRKEAA